MFFHQHYIPAVPIREEQRLSEEEELARELKREARIFFPDKKLPDFPPQELPPLPEEPEKRKEDRPLKMPDTASGRQSDPPDEKDHDATCREEDSLRRHADGSITSHEIAAARREAEQIERKKSQLGRGPQSTEIAAGNAETQLENETERRSFPSRLNKNEIRQGIRLSVILDKPRGLEPWKEANF
ncbi:MAG: hypothetical protein IJV12_03040 [Acidaminococcaceae bacterium]|nr:hypothetical protein [Acidaminococcaceae bacterium]